MNVPIDIDDEFEAFMRQAYGPSVSPAQYRESRRVFYAGVALMFHHSISLADLPEDDGIKELKQIDQQLVAFNEQVKEEKD
jgi:hypothetical protein